MQLTIAYDGSDGAARAIAAAAQLFPGAAAKVVVVPDPTPAVPSEQLARITTAIEQAASGLAEAGAEAAAAAGLDAEGFVAPPQRAGSGPGVLDAAAGSDVLVCGSRGQGGLARAMLGSTSSSLLHHATLPLLIVPDVRAGRRAGGR